jgi:hypothetical protein
MRVVPWPPEQYGAYFSRYFSIICWSISFLRDSALLRKHGFSADLCDRGSVSARPELLVPMLTEPHRAIAAAAEFTVSVAGGCRRLLSCSLPSGAIAAGNRAHRVEHRSVTPVDEAVGPTRGA